MTAAHGLPAHGAANPLQLLAFRALRPLIENQRGREGSPSFGEIDLASTRAAAAAGAAAGGTATRARGPGLPRKGGRPPIQGWAFSHRLPFLHLPEAAGGDGRKRARVDAVLRGAGPGYGDRA